MVKSVGPLAGVRVLEMASVGPSPMCGMMLGDLGADVVRVDRMAVADLGLDHGDRETDLLNRSKRSVAVDLKSPEGVAAVLKLARNADILIEGMRPGVMERLGLGPEDCWEQNPALVYGRVTGWGQDGPLAPAAGHDLNYIALTGALATMGRQGDAPVPPLNMLGDFGGGAMYLAMGVLAALLEARQSGKGQVVDTAMIDGASNLMMMIYGLFAQGNWLNQRGKNILDTGAHFYNVYETSDGKFITVGAIESKFYHLLYDRLGLTDVPAQMDRQSWPENREAFAALFRTRTRDQWCDLLEGTDVCFAPVLDLAEAPGHPHNAARQTFLDVNGAVQPNVAPRFSRTATGTPTMPAAPGDHTAEAMAEWGIDASEIEAMKQSGAIR